MSSVKRYEVNGSSSFYEDEKGSFVDYEDYAALEAKCAALAAENAGLKDYRPQPSGAAMMEALDAFYEHDDVPEQGMMAAFEILCCKRPKTPATASFLAELRAQGAEECVRQLVISDDDDFLDAPNVCAMVAHQLRKGVQS